MTDLPFDYPDAASANPAAPQPRKCRRHDWGLRVIDHGTVEACFRCSRVKADIATVSRVRRASARGFRTSADLAKYLGGQNVDKLGWPWDVQGTGYRIQSKRLADRPSLRAMVALLEAIPFRNDTLRAVFYVPPRARLTSGLVICWLREWVDWHNWAVPQEARIVHGAAGTLLELPLPVFRDAHIGVAA